MTSTEVGTRYETNHSAGLAVRPSDSRLAALLESKPTGDQVPLEVWWYLAESLRHSVPVRRAREGVAILGADVLKDEIDRARLSACAALARLGQGPSDRRTVTRPGPLSVRTSIYELARLVVSARPTSLETLRGAVLDHLDALGSP